MRLTPRNKTKLRRNMAIYRDYDDVIKGEKCLDILGIKEHLIQNGKVYDRYARFPPVDSRVASAAREAVANVIRGMKPSTRYDFPTVAHKRNNVMGELSKRLNSVIPRHHVTIGRPSDGIARLSHMVIRGTTKRFTILATTIPAMNVMKDEGGFLPVFYAVVNSETYKGTYPIGCTNFHVEEHDMGEIRYCFLHFFRTDKQRDKGIQYKWMCQTKGSPCVIGIGDCPDSAFKAMRRYAAKRVVKEIDTTMERRREGGK